MICSLTAAKIFIPGVDTEIDSITGNLEAAMRFGLVTNTIANTIYELCIL